MKRRERHRHRHAERKQRHGAGMGVSRSPRSARPEIVSLVWQIPLSTVATVVISLGLQWMITRMRIPVGVNISEAFLNLAAVVVLGGLLALVAVKRWRPWLTPLAWTGLAALGTMPLALLLHGTRFYLFGLSGDQFFRTQYLTRLTESAALADGNYADTPPYYPAGWFWVGGRFANLLGLPAWAAYKPWAIVTMAVAAVVTFVLWSTVIRRSFAVMLAILTCLVGLRAAAYEPYSWVLVAVIVPTAVITWRHWRAAAADRSQSAWPATVLAGLALGLCAAVYTLLALFFAALLFSMAVLAAANGHQTIRNGQNVDRDRWWPAWFGVSRLAVSGLIALPLGLLVWLRYLLRLTENPSPGNPAGHFLPKAGAELPTPMLEFSVLGLICLAGAVWLVWALHRSDIAQACGVLIIGCYLWYLASILALTKGTTLLAFRSEPVLLTCLACAGALGAFEILGWLVARFSTHAKAVVRTALTLSLLGMLVLTQTIPAALESDVTPEVFTQAYATYDDGGHRASPEPNSSEGGSYNGEVIAAIRELSGKPAQDIVLLTSETQLLALRPYRGFQTTNSAYANPLAGYDQRRTQIESWARSGSERELLAALDRSVFTPPTAFVFTRGAKGLHMLVSRDTFPRDTGIQAYDVVFPESLFTAGGFARRDVGPYAVIVRR